MRQRKAFTLIELLTTIAIIGVISAVAVVATNSSRDKAKLAAAQDFEARVQHAAGSDLIGEWLFNEGSGTTARDTSGNGRNGTITGAVWGTGVNGGALVLLPGRYVVLPSDAALNPPTFTITAWIKPGDFSGPYNYIYSNARDCCGSYNGINFSVAYNTLTGTIWNAAGGWPGGAQWVNSSAGISNSPVWTFVAFSYDGSKMALYVNGRLDKTATATYGLGQPASFTPHLGAVASCPAGCDLNGSLDQVRLYGTAIVASDIEKMYLAQKEKFFAAK